MATQSMFPVQIRMRLSNQNMLVHDSRGYRNPVHAGCMISRTNESQPNTLHTGLHIENMPAGTVSPVVDSTEITRPLANFPPTIWGDHFLSYESDLKTIDASVKQEYNELKEEVRRMLTTAAEHDKPLGNLDLINTVQRLGVSYHFEKEIEDALEKIYHETTDFDHNTDDDLYTIALWFRLLRQQGYGVSCDAFNKFKDEEGKFKESLICDIRGMLSLYEAAHLSIHADEILDEALVFTTTHLEESVVSHTIHDPSLERQVIHALNRPLRKGLPRLEARHYLSFYGKEDSRNETLLRFAKLDFNILQSQHQKELSYITKWWKDLDIPSKLPYTRNRIVELYFWVLGVYFEPQYSLGRRLLTKINALTTILDDTYDAYGTLDELELFTQAMQRWDISVIEQLPEYMKVIYKAILDVYNEMEAETAKEGRSYGVHYAKESMKNLVVRGYFQEAKWFNEGYFPTVEEYMPVGLLTAGCQMLAPNSFVTMGEVATKEAFVWVSNDPKIVKASAIITRLMDDLVSHKFEQNREHLPSGVECYMKQYGVSEEEVVDLLKKQVQNAWKDINEEFIKPTAVPAPLLERVLNLTRVIDVIYKGADGCTNPHMIKDSVASLLKDPIPI